MVSAAVSRSSEPSSAGVRLSPTSLAGRADCTKFNRRIDRFQRRGRSAARSEWRLITATHNLLKLHKHQTALTVA